MIDIKIHFPVVNTIIRDVAIFHKEISFLILNDSVFIYNAL